MEKEKKSALDGVELLKLIKNNIDRKADEKTIKNYNENGSVPLIDRNKIEQQVEEDYWRRFSEELDKTSSEVLIFYENLQKDNPDLYHQLKAKTPLFDLQKIKTLEEFNKVELLRLTEDECYELYLLGTTFFNEGNFAKAFEYLNFLSFHEKENPDVWLAKGMTEQALKKYNEALQSYKKSIKLTPSFLIDYLLMVDCLVALNRREEANKIFELFVNEVHPNMYPDHEVFQDKVQSLKEKLDKLL